MSSEIKLAILLALLCIAFLAGHRVASNVGALKLAQAQAAHETALAQVAERALAAEKSARAREQTQAERFAAQAAQYEQDKSHAQADADSTIADLRAGNLRLRREWQGCAERADHLPEAAAAAGGPDAAAGLRQQGAGDLVRITDQCTAQVRGLQSLLIEERRP